MTLLKQITLAPSSFRVPPRSRAGVLQAAAVVTGVARVAGRTESLAGRDVIAIRTRAEDVITRPTKSSFDEKDLRLFETLANHDDTAQRLMTAPGVGPIVALTYVAVLDTPARFGGDARRASAFLGLVPSEDSSGERRHKGGITKTGPPELRSLLIQASWTIWRGRTAAGVALRTWAHALAARRGRRVAIVALARRLSRILFAMWRDETTFEYRQPAIAA